MSDDALIELRALSEATTPGPWSAADEHGLMPGATPAWCVSRSTSEGEWLYDIADLPQTDPQDEYDALFIVAAVNYVRDLLAAPSDTP